MVVTESDLFLFTLIWKCVYWFRIYWFITLCHSFGIVNMRFVVKVIFFPHYILREELRSWKVFYRIFLFLFFFSQMILWMNKLLFTENNFLHLLLEQFSALYVPKCLCLEYSSIKIHRRSVVKVVITLLIKQYSQPCL